MTSAHVLNFDPPRLTGDPWDACAHCTMSVHQSLGGCTTDVLSLYGREISRTGIECAETVKIGPHNADGLLADPDAWLVHSFGETAIAVKR